MTLADDGYLVFNPHIPVGLLQQVVKLAWDADATDGHLPLPVRKSVPVMAIARHIVKSDSFVAVMSAPCCLHMPPMVRRVAPGDERAFVPAHQDVVYNRHIKGSFVTVWLPLVDIDINCRGIAVWPRSHQRGEIPCDPPQGNWLGRAQVHGEEGVELYPLKAGTAVLMDSYLVHESCFNHSDHPRFSIDYRFFSKSVSSTKPSLEVA